MQTENIHAKLSEFRSAIKEMRIWCFIYSCVKVHVFFAIKIEFCIHYVIETSIEVNKFSFK